MTCGNNLCVFISFETTIPLLQIKVEKKSCYRLKKNTIKRVKVTIMVLFLFLLFFKPWK